MKYNEYQNFKNTVDLYFKKENPELLKEIKISINTVEGLRERIIGDLKYNHHYIKIFNEDEQIQIIGNTVKEISSNHSDVYDVQCFFIYVSNEVIDKVLNSISESEIRMIMNGIKETIDIIGHRYCDTTHYLLRTTTIFSRFREKRTWKKLYRKCEAHLK